MRRLLRCVKLFIDPIGTNTQAVKANAPNIFVGGVLEIKPDDDLLSHWLQHYHRRKVVSRSCSGWEGVGPTRYSHQA
jgi:hypothetical protein